MDNLPEETPSETRRPFPKMRDLLRHPLILLLATGLISGLMVPYIANWWQDQREQRDLKAALVAEMSRSISEIIVATQFAFLGAESQSQADFDLAYRKWEVDRIVNGVKILGLTRNSTLAADWDMLAERVTNFYAVVGYNDPEKSLENLRSIAQVLPRLECTVLPKSDRQGPHFTSIHSLQDAWSSARTSILTDLGSLIGCVLE